MSQFNRREMLAASLGVCATATAPNAHTSNSSTRSEPVRSHGRIAPDQPVVRTNSGLVRGFTSDGVNVFRGIPYGARTDGENRFMPPRPPRAWDNVLDTLNYGQECPFAPPEMPAFELGAQDRFLLYRFWTPHIAGEDCLRLNVCAPAGSGRRPVMVYMHGGALIAGSGNDLLAYDGENLARRGDVVLVTHNHRLNAFGFLDLSQFGGRWADSANVGLQDIVAVLQWVRDNIAQFGGDPSNVTIFGQSGGGVKVHALLRMPSAKGLFHKAIIQSGVVDILGSIDRDVSRAMTERILKNLGLDENSLDQLPKLSTAKVCAAALPELQHWKTVVDGKILTEPLDPQTAPTLAHGVPLMIGTNLNELVIAVDKPEAAQFDEAALLAAVRKRYADKAPEIIAAYRAEYPRLPLYEVYCAIEAIAMRDPSFTLAASKYASDGKAWQYLFTWRTPMLGGTPGCFHSAEIAFVFDNAGLCINQTGGGPEALSLASKVSGAWLAFARHGNPNHAGLPQWPAFDARQPTMVFDDACAVKLSPEARGRALIREASKT